MLPRPDGRGSLYWNERGCLMFGADLTPKEAIPLPGSRLALNENLTVRER